MSIVALIVIGAAAGFLATRLMGIEADIPTTMFVGIVGALLGGLILRALATMMGAMAGFVGAVLGALLVLWLWKTYRQK